jgi:8-oxo-dGTP pyrophosphatase MutT (NUDIX family)
MSYELAAVRERLRSRGPRAPITEDAPAAVAAVLREGAEGSEVLFIKRAERAGDPWSGDIAFPGGKREPEDLSLYTTAVRETEEEVGLRLADAAFLVRLHDVRAQSSGYRVAQFVFALENPEAAISTSAEVMSTLWVPLARLARSEGVGTIAYTRDGVTRQLPCVQLGAHVLWGMTYRMVLQVIEALGE